MGSNCLTRPTDSSRMKEQPPLQVLLALLDCASPGVEHGDEPSCLNQFELIAVEVGEDSQHARGDGSRGAFKMGARAVHPWYLAPTSSGGEGNAGGVPRYFIIGIGNVRYQSETQLLQIEPPPRCMVANVDHDAADVGAFE
jgi:hypothetical protein